MPTVTGSRQVVKDHPRRHPRHHVRRCLPGRARAPPAALRRSQLRAVRRRPVAELRTLLRKDAADDGAEGASYASYGSRSISSSSTAAGDRRGALTLVPGVLQRRRRVGDAVLGDEITLLLLEQMIDDAARDDAERSARSHGRQTHVLPPTARRPALSHWTRAYRREPRRAGSLSSRWYRRKRARDRRDWGARVPSVAPGKASASRPESSPPAA